MQDEKRTRRLCSLCGGTIVNTSIKGEKRRFHAMILTINSDIIVPTCTDCGAKYLDKKTASDIDKHLRGFYASDLQHRAIVLIKGLMTHTTQWKIEWLLGLSHGYLSRVKKGKTVPSAALVAALAFIAAEPKTRIAELEDLWGIGNLDDTYQEMREQWRKEEEE